MKSWAILVLILASWFTSCSRTNFQQESSIKPNESNESQIAALPDPSTLSITYKSYTNLSNGYISISTSSSCSSLGLQTKTGTCDFEPKISGAMVSVEFKENSQICSLHNLSNTQYKGLIRIISRSICNVDSIDQSGLKSKILCGVSPNTIVSEASDLNDCEIVSRD